MCRMTDTGFRWSAAMFVPLTTAKWYVYDYPLGRRYSQKLDYAFRPLYAIRIRAATQPKQVRMWQRKAQGGAWDGETF
jgi:hypothetical protein